MTSQTLRFVMTCSMIWALALLQLILPLAGAQAASFQITGLRDVNMPAWSLGDGAVTASIDICAYAVNIPAANYAITASSPGGFVLTSGINQIPYSLTWNDGGSGNLGNTGTPLTNNIRSGAFANASILSPLCALGIGATARLNIRIAQEDLTAAMSGTYTGTLTLTMSPI